MIDPSSPKHQIRLASVSFPDLNISNATFRIQPQYGQIFITCPQFSDSNGQLVTNITISMNITNNEEVVNTPIDDRFIGTNIARVSAIPTTTSELTNDSNFITNAALTGYATETYVSEQLATKQDVISDLATIRSGSEAGATAVQPAALSEYAKTSEVATAVSTAISNQTKETWTFTLADGSTVTKSIVLGA